MNSATGILAVIFGFVIILVVINNIHEYLMKDSTGKKAKRFAEKKKAEKAREEKNNPDNMSREDLLKEMEKLNQRIENMDIILKERKKNGN